MNDFEHGGNINDFAKDCNCSPDEIIDLSSNINFLHPNREIDLNTITLSNYPDYTQLYAKIANYYNVNNSQIELFNGASSAIFALMKNINLSECTIYAPAYSEYQRAAQLNGFKINLINRFKNIETDNIKENSLVIFVNPSTPDGKYYNLTNLLKLWKEKNCTIIIDESFIEFTQHTSITNLINSLPKLYVIKSLTKYFGMAGVRLGIIISNENNIANIAKDEPLWKISELDMAYTLSILNDKKFIEKSQKINESNKEKLFSLLNNYKFKEKIYHSDANFFLLKLHTINAEQFQEQLIPYKIVVRNCANFAFLDNRFVRIAVKDLYSIKELEKALNA